MINTLNGKKSHNYISFFMVISIGMIFLSLESHNQYVYAEDNYTEIPVITILTHGLGGSPKDWSNNNYFYNDNVVEYPSSVHFGWRIGTQRR